MASLEQIVGVLGGGALLNDMGMSTRPMKRTDDYNLKLAELKQNGYVDEVAHMVFALVALRATRCAFWARSWSGRCVAFLLPGDVGSQHFYEFKASYDAYKTFVTSAVKSPKLHISLNRAIWTLPSVQQVP